MEKSTKIKLVITAVSIIIEIVLGVAAYCLFSVLDFWDAYLLDSQLHRDKFELAAAGVIAGMVFIVILNVIIWLSGRIFESDD